jgi:alpha-beta hydrolase superfamily lysophospholipase
MTDSATCCCTASHQERSLEEVTPRLVDAGYWVIAPDLAGFGRSDAPGEVETHVGNQATSSTGAPVRRRRAIS